MCPVVVTVLAQTSHRAVLVAVAVNNTPSKQPIRSLVGHACVEFKVGYATRTLALVGRLVSTAREDIALGQAQLRTDSVGKSRQEHKAAR